MIVVGDGTPAAEAGLQPEDILVQPGEEDIEGGGDLRRLIRQHEPGDVVELTVIRRDDRRTVRAPCRSRRVRTAWKACLYQQQYLVLPTASFLLAIK